MKHKQILGKTVTTFLIDGDPKGLQYVWISNRICRMYQLPRVKLSELGNIQELHQPALYILMNDNDFSKPMAYIGETENFAQRVSYHNRNKQDWDNVLIFIAQDNSLTKVDVQYLEALAIGEALEVNNYDLSGNRQIPNNPNMPQHEISNMQEFYEDIKFLIEFRGVDIFKTINQEAIVENKNNFFLLKSKSLSPESPRYYEASAYYDANGTKVVKGSIIAKGSAESLAWKDKRKTMITDFCIEKEGHLVMKEDRYFSSPSAAASFCSGLSMNGWVVWLNKDQKSLDEVFRNNIEVS